MRSLEGSREDLRAGARQEPERENHSNWRIREGTKLQRASRGRTKGGLLNAKKDICLLLERPVSPIAMRET